MLLLLLLYVNIVGLLRLLLSLLGHYGLLGLLSLLLDIGTSWGTHITVIRRYGYTAILHVNAAGQGDSVGLLDLGLLLWLTLLRLGLRWWWLLLLQGGLTGLLLLLHGHLLWWLLLLLLFECLKIHGLRTSRYIGHGSCSRCLFRSLYGLFATLQLFQRLLEFVGRQGGKINGYLLALTILQHLSAH